MARPSPGTTTRSENGASPYGPSRNTLPGSTYGLHPGPANALTVPTWVLRLPFSLREQARAASPSSTRSTATDRQASGCRRHEAATTAPPGRVDRARIERRSRTSRDQASSRPVRARRRSACLPAPRREVGRTVLKPQVPLVASGARGPDLQLDRQLGDRQLRVVGEDGLDAAGARVDLDLPRRAGGRSAPRPRS